MKKYCGRQITTVRVLLEVLEMWQTAAGVFAFYVIVTNVSTAPAFHHCKYLSTCKTFLYVIKTLTCNMYYASIVTMVG